MRRPIIAGNWKMFKTRAETRAFFDALIPADPGRRALRHRRGAAIHGAATAVEEAEGTRVAISAQDVHWEKQGAFTGEVSVRMLVDVGCTYTIIGHSERRQYFGETDETVEKKTRAAIAGGLESDRLRRRNAWRNAMRDRRWKWFAGRSRTDWAG